VETPTCKSSNIELFLAKNPSVDAGITFSLKVTDEGQTMSVLVLGDDPVTWRRCEGHYQFDLKDWFACVEMMAWSRASAYNRNERPQELFLVTGQYLASSYAISHKQYGSSECEVVLEAVASVPGDASVSALAGCRVAKAQASIGFESIVTKGVDADNPSDRERSGGRQVHHQSDPARSGSTVHTPILYSIFINTYPSLRSGPLQIFKTPLKTAIEDHYKYTKSSLMCWWQVNDQFL
jgi:hypothetical protein